MRASIQILEKVITVFVNTMYELWHWKIRLNSKAFSCLYDRCIMHWKFSYCPLSGNTGISNLIVRWSVTNNHQYHHWKCSCCSSQNCSWNIGNFTQCNSTTGPSLSVTSAFVCWIPKHGSSSSHSCVYCRSWSHGARRKQARHQWYCDKTNRTWRKTQSLCIYRTSAGMFALI